MLGTNAELDFMLADVGSAVVYGGVTVSGDLAIRPAGALTPEGVMLSERSILLTIREGTLAGLVVGGAITVDGDPYHIRDCGHPLATGLRTLTLAEG